MKSPETKIPFAIKVILGLQLANEMGVPAKTMYKAVKMQHWIEMNDAVLRKSYKEFIEAHPENAGKVGYEYFACQMCHFNDEHLAELKAEKQAKKAEKKAKKQAKKEAKANAEATAEPVKTEADLQAEADLVEFNKGKKVKK